MLSVGSVAPWSRAQVGTEPRGAWRQTNTDPATARPSPRDHAAVAFDPGQGRVVLFGGRGPNGQRLNDTWTWDGTTWSQANPADKPSPRFGAVMAFDGERLVLFGGDTVDGVDDDLWLWDGANWVGVPPSERPEPRRDATMAYDQRSNRLVLFGGAAGFDVMNDTWVWDGTTETWSEVPPPADPSGAPPGRWDAAMAFDAHPDAQHVVLFGGRAVDHDLNDTWVWDGVTWSERPTPAELGARAEAAMSFDPKAKSVVLFGGRQRPRAQPGQAPEDKPLNDTWLWDGTTWVDGRPASPPSPPPARSGGAMAPSPVDAADPERPQVMLFGGRTDPAAEGMVNDTWLWNGTAPVVVSSTTTSTTTPSSSSTTSTTAAGGRTANDGFSAPPPAANAGGSGGGSGGGALTDGGGGGASDATPTGGGRTGNVNNPGAFEGTPGADGSFGFSPGAAATPGLEGAAAATGAAAAPPPPIPAGAGTPPPANPGYVLQGGGANSAPVGAAAPGAGVAPRPASRFLMVGTDEPAALAALAGAGLMLGLFCFRVARRPRPEPAPAWASGT